MKNNSKNDIDFIPARLFSLVNWMIERTSHPLAVALVLARSRQTLLFLRREKIPE